ncbi:hypothetical protein B9G55_08090 [Saccharibacillus sp. O16]|nr:hypothetical protein B9G55_08090 [Saccharibacillus sp. O16]
MGICTKKAACAGEAQTALVGMGVEPSFAVLGTGFRLLGENFSLRQPANRKIPQSIACVGLLFLDRQDVHLAVYCLSYFFK